MAATEDFENVLMERVGLSNVNSNNDFDWGLTQYCREVDQDLKNKQEEIRYRLHLLHTSVDAFKLEDSKERLSKLVDNELSKLRAELDFREDREQSRIQRLYSHILSSTVTTQSPQMSFPGVFAETSITNKKCLACDIHRNKSTPDICPLPDLHTDESYFPCSLNKENNFEFLGDWGGWIFRTTTDLRPPPDYLPHTLNNSTSRTPPLLPRILSVNSCKAEDSQNAGNRLLTKNIPCSPATPHFTQVPPRLTTPILPQLHEQKDIIKKQKEESLMDSTKWAKKEVKRLNNLKSWTKEAEVFLRGIEKQRQVSSQIKELASVKNKFKLVPN